MKLNRKQVTGRAFYGRADRDAFELSIKILQAKGFRIPPFEADIRNVIVGFDKAFWLAESTEFSAGIDNRIPGYEVVHQAIHVLVAQKYGNQMRGKPRLTLLSEALAGATEFYYALQFTGKGGDNLKSDAIRHYKHNSKMLKKGFVTLFNRALCSPFEGFKANARASEKILLMLLESFKLSLKKQSSLSLRELRKKIRSVEHFVFLRHKDFPNFILFTTTHCGLKSTHEDLADCSDLHRILSESTSLIDFMEKLGAREVVGKKTSFIPELKKAG